MRKAQARPTGRPDPQRRLGCPARAARRPGAGGDRAALKSTRHCRRRSRPEPGPGQVQRGARGSRAPPAQSSTPRRAPPPRTTSRRQLLLDAIADELDVQVGQERPDRTTGADVAAVRHRAAAAVADLQENNQLAAMFADVRRGLAVAAVIEAATVTDTDGNAIDTSEFFGPAARGPTTDRSRRRRSRRRSTSTRPARSTRPPNQTSTQTPNQTRPTRPMNPPHDAVSERARFRGSKGGSGWLVSVATSNTRKQVTQS